MHKLNNIKEIEKLLSYYSESKTISYLMMKESQNTRNYLGEFVAFLQSGANIFQPTKLVNKFNPSCCALKMYDNKDQKRR